MTKVKAVENIYEQPLSAKMLLRSYTKTEELIDMYGQKNDSVLDSIPVNKLSMYSSGMQRTRMKPSKLLIEYQEPLHKKKRQRWLNEVQNQRSGKFYTLENLIQSARINESERSLFSLPNGVDDYPFREIIGFQRVKADNKEWFSTFEQWTGITFNAVVITTSVENLHWYLAPSTQVEYRTPEGNLIQLGDNNTSAVQLNTIRPGTGGQILGNKVFTTPFLEEIVQSALKYRCGEWKDQHKGHTFSIGKPESHVSAGVTLEEFLHGDFNETFEKHTMPPKPMAQSDIDKNFDRMAQNIAKALRSTGNDTGQYQ